MVVIRPKVLVDAEYVSQTAYTLDLDLPTTGKLSTLFLKVKAKTVGDGAAPSPWMKYLISSISVNQAGQAALNAAPPEVFQADYYYKTGKMPMFGYRRPEGDAVVVDETIPILFGEKVDDPDHYIDLSRLSDPKLSITYNLAETDLKGETLWETGYYPRFTVLANLFGDVGLPMSKGYYSLRQIEGYTPANSEKHMLELKGRRPIKRLYYQVDKTDCWAELEHLVTRARIWGDNESYIPFDLEATPWMDLTRELYGVCEAIVTVVHAKGGQHIDMIVDKDLGSVADIHQANDLMAVFRDGSGRRALFYLSVPTTGAASVLLTQMKCHFKGLLPWGVGAIDMPKMLGIEHLDPTEHAPIFLQVNHAVNAGDYSAPCKIHVEDLVTVY